MKKNIIIPILLSLFIFVGCVEDLPQTSMVEIEPGSTYLSLRSSQITVADDATVESITLKSLRILVFKKEGGQIVTNKKFDITSVNATEQEDGSWIADFSTFVAPTNPGLSVVYAVLNEDVSEVSGHSLTNALDGVATLTDMQNLVNTPLTYIPLRVVYDTNGNPIEPPFVMVAYDEFEIPANRPITDPFHADLRGLGGDSKGFAMDRSMAKVTIKDISNTNFDGSALSPEAQAATSSIFILKMGLVNVPETYKWSPNSSEYPVQAYSGAYQTIDFALEDAELKYYKRNWDGSITAKVRATVTWTQHGKRTIYKIEDNKGVKSYGPVPPKSPYAFDAGVTPGINNGNFIDFLKSYLSTTGESTDFNLGDIEYANPQILNPTVSPGKWDLIEKNISYYVSEHILQNNAEHANATKLYVKAVKASLPAFNSSNVKFEEREVTWYKKGTTTPAVPNSPDWVYPTESYVDSLIAAGKFFIPEPAPAPNSGKFYHKLNAGLVWRKATGTVDATLTTKQFGDIINSTVTKEFYLPIQNTPATPIDYNIYRNNEYKFSVHVLDKWWTDPLNDSGTSSQTSTRSSWEDPNQSMVLRIVPE